VPETGTRSRWRSLGEVYVSTLGLSLAVAATMEWTGTIALLYCGAIAVGPTLGALAFLVAFDRRFRAFFGLARGSTINLAVASFQNVLSENPNEADRSKRYYKEYDGQRLLLRGPETYLVGLETAATVAWAALEFGRATRHEINVVGDEEPSRLTDGPVIAFGSPTSNNLTHRLIKSLPSNWSVAFTTETLTCWTHPEPYRASSETDFALLIRLLAHDRLHFVCAGIDGEGSVAVSRHLVRNWRKLPRCQFAMVFKCNKRTFNVELISGRYLNPRTQEWQQSES